MSEISGKVDSLSNLPCELTELGLTTEELLATAMAPPIPEPAYKPTRLEHFAVQILQGLIVGRSDQILPKVVSRSIALAKKLELALDVEQNL